MKTKYQRLNKKDRKKARISYYSTPNGAYVKRKLNSSLFCAILCEVFGIYLIAEAIFKELSTWQYVYGASIMLFGLFFIIAYFIVIAKKVNKYVIESKIKF